MNMNYLKTFYESNKERLLDCEQEIKSFEEFKEYIYSTVLSNIQYDFGIDIDLDNLLKTENLNKVQHVSRFNVERNLNYFKYSEGAYHDMYIAMLIKDVMNVPFEWVSNDRLDEIEVCIYNNEDKIFNDDFVAQLMDIEKKIEKDKGLRRYEEKEEEIEK